MAFDIDDTLLRHRQPPNYLSPESILESCLPIRAACGRVLGFIDAGYEVHFVTARTKVLLSATLAQLKTWISTSITAGQVHCNGTWAGYDHLRVYKADCLRAIGAVAYVGDHASDEAAAMDAGIPFLHADRFAAGDPLLLVQPPCECARLTQNVYYEDAVNFTTAHANTGCAGGAARLAPVQRPATADLSRTVPAKPEAPASADVQVSEPERVA